MFVSDFLKFTLLLAFFGYSYAINCRDEKDKDVDWFINYKLPAIDKESDALLKKGEAYAYIKAPGSSTWKLSSKSIKSDSMLQKTMDNLYSNQRNLTYLFYNDETPINSTGTSVGHLKGVVAFDGTSGFWLVHSIPKFANDKFYEYPDNALLNGQSIFCVTFKTSELNEISNQLLYSHPNIYSYAITDEVKEYLDEKARSLFTDNPAFVRKGQLTRTTPLKSLGNKAFVSFAKDNQYKVDIYSDIIAPGLKSSLLTETWRRGSGTVLPPSCQVDYSVIDIVSINMIIRSSRNSKSIFFKSTEDHSKWAISSDGSGNWVCIGDLNRMLSQSKRGGGSLCFSSAPVRTAFRSIISETDTCSLRNNSVLEQMDG